MCDTIIDYTAEHIAREMTAALCSLADEGESPAADCLTKVYLNDPLTNIGCQLLIS